MSWNKAIGGYFELELNDFGSIYHNDLVALNSGRNALKYILIQRGFKKIYIPYYTCNVILQPLLKQNVNYEFYHIDNNFYPKDVSLHKNEALLYVNYFGIMNKQVEKLSQNIKNLIVDNSQAFFEKPLKNVDTFYSPRKFFGLPDGGFAYCTCNYKLDLERDVSIDRISHLLTRIDKDAETGYDQFKLNDEKLNDLPLKKMSRLTERLMLNIDYERIKEQRQVNFNQLHKLLYHQNVLTPIINDNSFVAPMIYPFLKQGNQIIRENLISNKIYTATYWPNVKGWLDNNNSWENYLQENLIAIPIDQRYDKHTLDIIHKTILNEL